MRGLPGARLGEVFTTTELLAPLILTVSTW